MSVGLEAPTPAPAPLQHQIHDFPCVLHCRRLQRSLSAKGSQHYRVVILRERRRHTQRQSTQHVPRT